MASSPSFDLPSGPGRGEFEQQLREMNEALLIASVQQHELADQARQAHAEAHESKERYRTLFDFVPMAVYACATSRVIQKFNRRAAELWGREPAVGETDERFCGSFKLFRSDGSFMPPDQCLMADVLSGKLAEVRDAEVLIERPDGSRIFVVMNIHPLKNHRGEIAGAINCFHDITERKQLEERLRESETRFRALVMASSDIVYRMSPDWSVMRQLVGRNFIADTEQPSNTWLQEYIHPQDQLRVMTAIQESVRTNSIFEMEYRVQRLDGTLGWTLSRAVPLLDAQGEVVEWFGAASDVTERKRAEEALRESEERYRNLFNSMDEGYCIMEMLFDEHEQPVDYRFLEVNPSFEKQCGLHNATGKRIREFYPNLEEYWFELYGKVALTGEPVRYVNEAKTMEGRWFDVYAFRIGGRDSRKIAVLFNDATLRIASEEALRQRAVELAKAQRQTLETLALVDALISNAPIGMAYYDHDLRFVKLNQALADINGLPLQAHLGRTIPELLPGIPEESLDQFRQVLATGRPILNCEVRGETPQASGELRWWLVNYYPVRVQTNEVHTRDTLGVGVAVLEITQQKRAEAAQRVNEQRLRFVMDSMPQKIFTANPDGELDYFNPQWTEFTGLSFQQMQDSGWTKLVHPDDVEEKMRLWQRAFGTGEPFQSEHRFRRADGEYRWHFSRALPMRDTAGRITMWVGSNTDVHDMKQAEAALQKQAAELSDLHGRRDEFLAMLSHELRNPLAPIINAVQMLRIQQRASGSSPQACEMIERQVGQFVHLVDDLLEVSRISAGRIHLQRKPVDLQTIVECSVETVRPLIDRHRHVLAVSLPSASLWIDGDSTRLEQVVVNLLNNAAKYTADGGQIWLSLRQEGHQAVLEVRDSGVGIAPELLPRIFDLFTQAERSLDRSQGGLGIGLCLVQRLVEMHGGQVAVSSVLGQGSEFVVRLPVLRTAEPPSLPTPTQTAPPSGSSLRILVVDDNIDSAISMAMLLGEFGHEVRTEHDGPAAVNAALDYQPDVVVLDIGMPGLNGYEIAKRIRQAPSLRNVMLVALTGYGQEADRQLALQAGFNHHLVKPARLEQIREILETVEKFGEVGFVGSAELG